MDCGFRNICHICEAEANNCKTLVFYDTILLSFLPWEEVRDESDLP